jgi:pimeloyl-ACP methyl ester carboxylesterase
MEITRVFIHGLDSSSHGTKGSFFRRLCPGMLMGDYEGPLEQRMAQLAGELAERENLILVGSSYGGLMAALYAFAHPERMRRLVLLAPALCHVGREAFPREPLQVPAVLYLGRFDELVLPGPTGEIAAALFSHLESHVVEDDHNLHAVFPTLDWRTLLEMAS